MRTKDGVFPVQVRRWGLQDAEVAGRRIYE
jgi:hypothetical protein